VFYGAVLVVVRSLTMAARNEWLYGSLPTVSVVHSNKYGGNGYSMCSYWRTGSMFGAKNYLHHVDRVQLFFFILIF
jgi:hypothetical protein